MTKLLCDVYINNSLIAKLTLFNVVLSGNFIKCLTDCSLLEVSYKFVLMMTVAASTGGYSPSLRHHKRRYSFVFGEAGTSFAFWLRSPLLAEFWGPGPWYAPPIRLCYDFCRGATAPHFLKAPRFGTFNLCISTLKGAVLALRDMVLSNQNVLQPPW